MNNIFSKGTIAFLLLFVVGLSSCSKKDATASNQADEALASQSDKMIVTTDNIYNPDLGNGYYLNPILKGDWADPTLIRVGEDYYMTSHSGNRSLPTMLIWHSKDLVNWEPMNYALNDNIGNVWAADLVKHEDKFYLYMPSVNRGTNYVITASDINGPWSKPVDLKVGGIDPGHIATPDGKRYLHVDAGYMVELNADGISVKTGKEKVFEGWPIPQDWIVECFCLESPKLIYRNGWYYMTVAQGGTAGPPTSHMATAARSRTPYGPWEHSPYNPIVKTNSRDEKWASMGHGTLIDTPKDEWFIVFHAYENDARHMGRQILMLPIEWTEDGWFCVPEGIDPAQPIKKPQGGIAVENKMKLSDDFSGDVLGVQWKMMYGDIREKAYLKDGSLRLKAEGENPMESHPVVIDPMNNYYQVEVDLYTQENVKSGLVFCDENEKYMGFELAGTALYRLTGWGYSREKVLDVNETDKLRVRLSNDHNDLLYWYSLDGGETWKRIDFVNNLTNWGGSTIRAGVYASGNGEARFTDFSYKGIE